MGVLKYLCHQKPERSFRIKNYQMPICSRCTGIYLGIIIGIITDFLKPLWNINVFYPNTIFTLSLIPIAIDGTGQLFGLWESNNKRRFLTGLLVGLATGATIRIITWFFVGV